jgi:D-alanyl-D-alanine carboxypeptidase
MAYVRSEARRGLRCCVLGLAAGVAALTVTSDAADARHHRRTYLHISQRVHHHSHAEDEGYSPPSSSIVVDGNGGEVLQASNPDALRHPASLTKIMTLYLLFERLDAGKIKLDTPLKVSAHAAGQAPSKLDLKPGQTIEVEDAIKAVVTKSANDVAVTIAENLGGDEESFAKLMTQKARSLGMSHTTYVNASGLPDDDQVTTARDMALLGRAIEDRFPRYYRYFATPSFTYHGEAMRNHNHLLGAVGGVDGIKTGYTRASGFNLVTSVHRDGRYIVAVVMGGPSAGARDAHMRVLINDHIKEASLRRTAPLVAEKTERAEEPQRVAAAKFSAATSSAATSSAAKSSLVARADVSATPSAKGSPSVGSSDPIQPLLVRTITYRTTPVQTAALAPMPALQRAPTRAASAAAPPPYPAHPQRTVPSTVASEPADSEIAVKSDLAKIQTASAEPIASEPADSEIAVKSDMAKIRTASAEPIASELAKPEPAKAELVKIEPAKVEVAKAEPVKAPPPAHAHSGWLIQIGAFEAEDEAKQRLSAAQLKLHSALASADPFTERVQKGDKAFYRARFAGFDKATAEATCKQLKHNDIDCMTLKN